MFPDEDEPHYSLFHITQTKRRDWPAIVNIRRSRPIMNFTVIPNVHEENPSLHTSLARIISLKFTHPLFVGLEPSHLPL